MTGFIAGTQPQGWQQLKIGAGGFLTGLDIAPDGTKLARADTNGVYLWDGSQWNNIINRKSLPASDGAVLDVVGGTWEIAIAPSNSNRFYVHWRGWIFRSDDRGRHWLKTSYTRDVLSDDGSFFDGSRLAGQKMAVDPNNPDVVYVSNCTTGIWKTVDGGSNWTQVSAITTGWQLTWTVAVGANPTFTLVSGLVPTSFTKVQFTNSGGALPGGLLAATDYFIIKLSSTTFNVQLASNQSSPTTTNAGSGTQTATVNSVHAGGAGICFDSTSGLTGGKTNVIIIPSFGNGVWRTANAGGSWTQIASGSSNPITVWHGQMDQSGGTFNGTYYCCEDPNMKVGLAWKYAAGTWTALALNGQAVTTIAVHPSTSGRVVMFCNGQANNARETLDAGSTWLKTGVADATGDNWSIQPNGTTYPGGVLHTPGGNNTATDIPWLGWTNDAPFKTLGDARFDPTSSGGNTLFIAEGIGCWTSVFPTTFVDIAWTSQSTGLEQLVSNVIASPPGFNPVFGCSDRPIFFNLNTTTYPSTHGPDNTASLSDCKDLRYCAGSPANVFAICNTGTTDRSCFSTDGGQSWTVWGAFPASSTSHKGGCMAVNSNDPTNVLWCQGSNGLIYRTTNAQAASPTWTATIPTGSPSSAGSPNWFSRDNLNRHIIEADQVDADTFYALDSVQPKLYISTDKGVTWSTKNSSLYLPARDTGSGATLTGGIVTNPGFNVQLRAVPGKSGHLFQCTGKLGSAGDAHPTAFSYFIHSTDHGATWAEQNINMLEVIDFAFGKARTTGGYPAIYVYGWLNGQRGFYRSEDEGVNWAFLSEFAIPDKNMQTPQCVGADMNTFGVLYCGMGNGGGFARGYFA